MKDIIETLMQAGLDKSEAREIVCRVCGCEKSDIYLNRDMRVSNEQELKIREIASLRKTGKPLAYCINSAYFYDREFFVNDSVLIPRIDTEILIETILKNENGEEKNVLELGTGSGIICDILQSKRQKWNIVSVDISESCLSVAKKNCNKKILLVNSDKFCAISPERQFDVIVSNPPYIESETIKTLDSGVKDFEPIIALDGGENGLEFYVYLATSAKRFLKRGGRIYAEIGFNQGESVPKIFEENGFINIAQFKDLGKNPRVVSAYI